MTTTLWSGRFAGAPDAAAFEFGASFRFDRRLFEDDVTGSIAWARALSKAGVLAPDEARRLERELADILERGRSNPASVDGPDEDVHSFVERLLVERLGDLGRRLHTGRSRNEQVSVDLRLYLRRRIPLLQRVVAGVVEALVERASAAGDGLMPSFTHFRPAQPVLVAHFFLAHVAALRRDYGRLDAAREESDALPLGSGAIAGTSYAIDVEGLARELGFSRVVHNSIDASSDRDFAASFLYACTLTMVHLSRLAEDIIILSGDEHRFFDLADALSTGSSMMPQKKNPDPLELVRGKSGRALGHLVALLTTLKGLPSGYNKDLQEDKEGLFDAEDTLTGCLAVIQSVVASLALNRDRMESAASGMLLATDVADYLVGRGVPFRRAHEIVGELVRRLVAEGREFTSLSLAEWQSASPLFGADIITCVTPRASVAAKRTPQSTSPAAVDARLAEARRWLTRAMA
ncbi:MAG: argininosuccinate lyase [Acidobacteria bacterium RIFCSPLOWO2_12_FULL_65_11]|nr:MAG: argininosuccinate lyase [Acidobacteria bacterium RIFCSPLOWO2_02_FULL_64_15]OFW29125.1 MAG: argininosuccinate lyase [Acidobacteria bacterium RIFCSPLOWO2_12_FULL_65_11]